MKKYIKTQLALVLILGLFLVNLGGLAVAQESFPSESIAPDIGRIMPPIYPDNSNSLLFGQKHSYSVIFRGNGEAITYAKLVVPNQKDQALSEFSFEIPNVEPSEMIIYQMKLPQECIRYNYTDPNNPCVEYREPDYGQDYYYYGSGQPAEYTKIKYTKSGNTYNLTLPNAVEPSKSTAIIISYAAKGYVDNSLGLYKFNFETIKVNSRIESVKVAVDVDSDLLLKDKKSSVNYNEGSSVSNVKLGDSASISAIRELDRVVSSIGNSGSVVKESKSLAPNESFNVRGEYAANWLQLYRNEIIISIVLIITIIVIIYVISKYISSNSKGNLDDGSNQDTAKVTINNKSINLFNITYAVVSLGSVIFTLITTYILRILSASSIWQNIRYDSTFSTLISIITILLYTVIMLSPAIIIALKRGWSSLLSIIIMELIWFILISILYLALFQTGMMEMMPVPRPLY